MEPEEKKAVFRDAKARGERMGESGRDEKKTASLWRIRGRDGIRGQCMEESPGK